MKYVVSTDSIYFIKNEFYILNFVMTTRVLKFWVDTGCFSYKGVLIKQPVKHFKINPNVGAYHIIILVQI